MAAGIRVDQLAKELCVESKEIIARCQKNGLGASMTGAGIAESMTGEVYDVVGDRAPAQPTTAVPLELLLAELATMRSIVEEHLVPAAWDLQKMKDEEALRAEEPAEGVIAAEAVAEISRMLATVGSVAASGEMQIEKEERTPSEVEVQEAAATGLRQVVEALPEPSRAASTVGQACPVEEKQADAPIGPVAQVRPDVDGAVMGVEKKKCLFRRIRLGASLGIYLSEDKLAWTLAERFPLGHRIAETFEQSITRSDWAAGVASVLEKYLVGRAKKNMRVVIGLPASQIYFCNIAAIVEGRDG